MLVCDDDERLACMLVDAAAADVAMLLRACASAGTQITSPHSKYSFLDIDVLHHSSDVTSVVKDINNGPVFEAIHVTLT